MLWLPPIFAIHPSVDGYAGSFSLLALLNNPKEIVLTVLPRTEKVLSLGSSFVVVNKLHRL